MSFTHVLVTGGAGFIGSNFVRFLLEQRTDIKVTNLDVLTYSGNLDNLEDVAHDPRYRFVQGDICDAACVEPLLATADAVVHMAAESHVDRSIHGLQTVHPTPTWAARRRSWTRPGACRVPPRAGGSSTSARTRCTGRLPLDRSRTSCSRRRRRFAPNSPYAASKACAATCSCAPAHHTFGMDVVTTRCSEQLRALPVPREGHPALRDESDGGAARSRCTATGCNVRDWLHVLDHCEAILTVLEKGTAGEAYNVGGNNERSNLELTNLILELMDEGEDRITHVPDRLGHDLRYAIDATRIATELGWRPTRSAWPGALKDTVDWYIANPIWWRRVKSGAYRRAPGARTA